MMSELFDKGMKIRTEVLGEAYVKKAQAGMDENWSPNIAGVLCGAAKA
jgi:hypothetical protein